MKGSTGLLSGECGIKSKFCVNAGLSSTFTFEEGFRRAEEQ